MQSQKRLIGLDIARSVAILAVLFTHFTQKFHYIKALYMVADFAGVLGVQLFFVLSGFLIGGILLRQLKRNGFTHRDVFHFWKRRWYRTLPNYLVCFVAIAALDKLLYHTLPPSRLLILYPMFLQNFVNPKPITQFFGVSWSLSVEEWAYLSLPLLLIAAGLLSNKVTSRARAALLTITVMILAPLLARLLTSIGLPWDAYVRKLVVYRLDSIGFGVLLAYLATFRTSLMSRLATNRNCALGVLLVLLMWINMAWELQNPSSVGVPFTGLNAYWMNGFWSVVVDIGMALIIARLATVASLPRKYGVWTWFFAECSVLSYSLYLWHPLVLEGVDFSYRNHAGSTRLYLFEIALYVALSVGVSWVVYRSIEKPIMDYRDRVVKAQPTS